MPWSTCTRALHAVGSGRRLRGLTGLAQFHKRVAYHEWEGVSHDFDEQNRIRDAIGERTAALTMRNHGACTGSDVAEAWVRAYYLEKCCQVQIDLLACQGRVIDQY